MSEKIEVDFSDHKVLLANLKTVAKEEERSLNGQVIYILKKSLKDWIGTDESRDR